MTQPHNAVQNDAVQDEALPSGGTTPVSNDLLDRVMPALRDTELRVLLVVVRQTLGWQASPGSPQRKERDWLTQSQLMRRTGRASGAVAHAVDVLVQHGLIDVLDGSERLLATPAERRRCRGRLYFRLHKIEVAPHQMKVAEIEHAKPHTTKYNPYKNKETDRRIVDNSVENPRLVTKRQWLQAGEIASTRLGMRQGIKTEASAD